MENRIGWGKSSHSKFFSSWVPSLTITNGTCLGNETENNSKSRVIIPWLGMFQRSCCVKVPWKEAGEVCWTSPQHTASHPQSVTRKMKAKGRFSLTCPWPCCPGGYEALLPHTILPYLIILTLICLVLSSVSFWRSFCVLYCSKHWADAKQILKLM